MKIAPVKLKYTTKKMIFKTKTFRSLSGAQKLVYGAKNNQMAVDRNVREALKVGYKNWLITTNSNTINKEITKEIYNQIINI